MGKWNQRSIFFAKSIFWLKVIAAPLFLFITSWWLVKKINALPYPEFNFVPIALSLSIIILHFILNAVRRILNERLGPRVHVIAFAAKFLRSDGAMIILICIIYVNLASFQTLNKLDPYWELKKYENYSLEYQSKVHPNTFVRNTRYMFYRLRHVLQGGTLIVYDNNVIPDYYVKTVSLGVVQVSEYDYLIRPDQISFFNQRPFEKLQLMSGDTFILYPNTKDSGIDARYRVLDTGKTKLIVPESLYRELMEKK